MTAFKFTPKLPTGDKLITFPDNNGLNAILKDAFKLPTLLAAGATVQILLSTILPIRYAILPASAYILNSLIQTIIQIRRPLNNAFTEQVLPGRTTTQLPFADSTFPPGTSDCESFVVFNVGVQVNHPLSQLAPGAQVPGGHYQALATELDTNPAAHGLLGSSKWQSTTRDSNNVIMNTYYFKDVESLHKFAHGELHKKAWTAYKDLPGYIGLWHETFVVEKNGWETMYLNMRPTGMGRASVQIKEGEKGEGEEWVNTLVSADKPALKTQYSRMNRSEDGIPKGDY